MILETPRRDDQRIYNGFSDRAISPSERVVSLQNSVASLGVVVDHHYSLRKYSGQTHGIATIEGRALDFVYDGNIEYAEVIWKRMQEKFSDKIKQFRTGLIE